MTVSGLDSAGPGGPYCAGPSAEEMAEQEATLAEEIAARTFEIPPEDKFSALLADPDCGPPEGPDAWLGDLASPVRAAILDARAAAAADGAAAGPDGPAEHGAAQDGPAEHGPTAEGALAAGPFPAAFLLHDGGGPGGAGFSSARCWMASSRAWELPHGRCYVASQSVYPA